MAKPSNRIAVIPADNTKRGQKRILDHFAYFIMNVEAGVNYHGFDNLKPIELELKLDPVTKEPVDPEEYVLHNFCRPSLSTKLTYLESFIVNIRKQVAMEAAFYYDLSVCSLLFVVCHNHA